MKRHTIFFIVLLTVVTIIGSYEILSHISKSHDIWVKSHKKMYCYQTYGGQLEPSLFVNDVKYIDSLKKLYKSIESGQINAVFNFPPLLVPTDTCVYVLNYSKDSTIAEIQFYQQFKRKHLVFVGYVYANTLHTQKRVWKIPENLH